MTFAYRHQPAKALYLVYQLLSTIFVRLPLWALLNTAPASRPRRSWTLKKAVMGNLIRHLSGLTDKTGPFVKTPNHTAITEGEGVNGVWVDGVGHLITGDLATWVETAKVSPVRLPGYWIHKPGTSIEPASGPQPGEKVILNLHGGAYCRLSAHPSDPTSNIPMGILEHTPSINRIFCLEYRLSVGEPFKVANPFPTALIDALAGYNYLVTTLGFSPSNILICGDSAGANLAHALTRYLVSHQTLPITRPDGTKSQIPGAPGGLILLSPWVDLSTSHDEHPTASSHALLSSDYLNVLEPAPVAGVHHGGIAYAKNAFTGPHTRAIADTNAYISPASRHPDFAGVSFEGFPRTFVVGGGAEVLIDQIRTFKDRMIRDLGEGDGAGSGQGEGGEEGKVRYYEAPDAMHDFLVFRWHEPERTETLREIARWIAIAA